MKFIISIYLVAILSCGTFACWNQTSHDWENEALGVGTTQSPDDIDDFDDFFDDEGNAIEPITFDPCTPTYGSLTYTASSGVVDISMSAIPFGPSDSPTSNIYISARGESTKKIEWDWTPKSQEPYDVEKIMKCKLKVLNWNVYGDSNNGWTSAGVAGASSSGTASCSAAGTYFEINFSGSGEMTEEDDDWIPDNLTISYPAGASLTWDIANVGDVFQDVGSNRIRPINAIISNNETKNFSALFASSAEGYAFVENYANKATSEVKVKVTEVSFD